ncbi:MULTISPECIES: hypothetical protein [unclassified Leptolyngbya]|uniref:hypothetical protein n=1 Tax=unclassified Leptolyngbya TaxID=2650499 RepID=UPI001687E8F6|nr:MULTISPECIES: hypothetical protein [unclassified Leptolyngbya]MBD1911342.1 hypothetical protein [Leptolyngbya sp. FACHB-8]MBD2156640.1 hypothetical protein [Leptolyngbya sp. FACHB-16]
MPPRKLSNVLTLTWIGLLLPSVGLAFWLVTGWMIDRVLSQTSPAGTLLEAEGQHQVNLALSLTIVSIDAEVNRKTQITEVSIRTVGSPLEEMEFKFPVAEFADIEQAIAQELNLPLGDIRKLIRYRIDE